MASTAVSVLANAVIMIAGSAASTAFAARSTSTPLMSGILMSEMTRSTAPFASTSRAASGISSNRPFGSGLEFAVKRVRRVGGLAPARQQDGHCGTPSQFRLHPHFAAVVADDAMDDGEAEA